MAKKTKIDPKDIADFQKAMSDVKPLTHKKIRLNSFKTPERRQLPEKTKIFSLNETLSLEEVGSEDFIAYKHESIPNKTLRKLRKGQYNVDAILDLHGMNIEEAREAVNTFLDESLQNGLRVVLIIHGKGRFREMPILKNKLNHWLRDLTAVLAFCSASSTHGSRGAIYILLKRMSEEFLSE